jgi:hypothetical protein
MRVMIEEFSSTEVGLNSMWITKGEGMLLSKEQRKDILPRTAAITTVFGRERYAATKPLPSPVIISLDTSFFGCSQLDRDAHLYLLR